MARWLTLKESYRSSHFLELQRDEWAPSPKSALNAVTRSHVPSIKHVAWMSCNMQRVFSVEYSVMIL